MIYMVKVEFLSSLRKEMTGSDDSQQNPEPHPYDVFLMETTVDHPKRHLAICLPVRGSRVFLWYNGGSMLYDLKLFRCKRKIASLSGPSRVLASLSESASSLTELSMCRSMIQDPIDNFDEVINCLGVSDVVLSRIKDLNDSQRQAVATVANPAFKHGFFAVQGPPGCGKTTCLTSMILASKPGILVVAPSNAAVANIALKIFESKLYTHEEIVVFGENSDPSVQFLSPTHRGVRFRKMLRDCEKAGDENKLEKKQKLIQEFISWIRIDNDDIDFMDLRLFCETISTKDDDVKALGALIRAAKVVFSTLNSAGSHIMSNNANFHTIMLDEAGQTSEAEFFIATNFPGVERIIQVGDPQQLPATVIDIDCMAAGYGKSWLGKIKQFQPDKIHLLDVQFRMDPQILIFPNSTFYGNRITSAQNVLSREPFVENPFLFIDTSGRGSEQMEELSWKNAYEAVVIKALLYTDPDIKTLLGSSPDRVRVIIITPYRCQAKLLRDTITIPTSCTLEIATVDSFQGQEGDIVILSTVRTNKMGFIDDKHRINVALTRAKRILRVIGDADFFQKQHGRSILKRLCNYAKHTKMMQKSQLRPVAWSRPNWSEPTRWKPIANSRFYECLRNLSEKDRNVSFNTLRAVALPDILALGSRIPERKTWAWYMSWLKGYSDTIRIIWIPKMGHKIEAHFVGGRASCYHFIQTNFTPDDACIVDSYLSDLLTLQNSKTIESRILDENNEEIVRAISSWAVTNVTQDAICNGKALPEASVELDEEQDMIARLKPPLIIESRSGTGKTLVLLQHAAYHSDRNEDRNVCFVTVSKRLCKQLSAKYDEMDRAENRSLPPASFFPFEELLFKLLDYSKLRIYFEGKERCRFAGFVNARSSHASLKIDLRLCENEIGGVIGGSVEAAMQGSPLNKEQYLATKRSNVSGKSLDGQNLRSNIFDVFELYAEWKRENDKYDLDDVVLMLLRRKWQIIFSSGELAYR
jgi:AAA domain